MQHSQEVVIENGFFFTHTFFSIYNLVYFIFVNKERSRYHVCSYMMYFFFVSLSSILSRREDEDDNETEGEDEENKKKLENKTA